MNYTEAVQAVGDNLANGDDDLAAAAAMHLALQAWRHLAAADATWDGLGLNLLDIQHRLYRDQDVAVEADPPRDGPGTRAAVAELLQRLARHHEALAIGNRPLPDRLEHDAAAQQLRRAAAALE